MTALRRIALVLIIVVLGILGAIAWILRSHAEPIPDELPPVDPAEVQKLTIPGAAGLPDLKLADLQGKTVYFLVEDRESMAAKESSTLSRAMARWSWPDDVQGYSIGDTQGFGLLKSKIEDIVAPMRPEIRLPLYLDFEGVATTAFKFPRGHLGVAIVDRAGAVVYRHSGPLEPDEIEQVRGLLGAQLPRKPPAPPFNIGGLDNAACKGKTCVFVLLSAPVARKDIPGGKQGFDGDMDESARQFARPDVRLAGIVVDSDAKLDPDKVHGRLVGAIDGAELKRWQAVPEAPGAREAFGLPEGETGLVVVDPSGDIAMLERGRVPMYKFGVLSELIGVELGDRDDP